MDLPTYEAIITPSALNGLEEAVNYIANTLNNKSAAQRLINDFSNLIERIKITPNGMPLTKTKYRNQLYHKAFVHNFITIYRVNEEKRIIYFVVFRYAPQNKGDSI